jgi:UDP-sulfoquinovose synthase
MKENRTFRFTRFREKVKPSAKLYNRKNMYSDDVDVTAESLLEIERNVSERQELLRKPMRVIVIGGDGFCGWPTALHLANSGHKVLILDNLSRRKIDDELETRSLTQITSFTERIELANTYVEGRMDGAVLDVSQEKDRFREVVNSFWPDAIIHFGQQRSAPYSMLSENHRCNTVNQNVSSTSNILSVIATVNPEIHLIHLGTMGVYGYSKAFGKIPEGYLDITINETCEQQEILYPANPGSIYHMTKCLDQLLFQFYYKNWGIPITDLHQGIVWGISTKETLFDMKLVNRFDYDGIYGTVLNRFLVQAVHGYPLTVYGTGGQRRAFIHISDTVKCVRMALENPPEENRVRIFNQVAETQTVLDLAMLVSDKYGVPVQQVPNPRKEAESNDLDVSNEGLKSLGFDPVLIKDKLMKEVLDLAKAGEDFFRKDRVLNSPKW